MNEAVIALGTFDGMHKGHAAVLLRAGEEARKRGCRFCVYTFTRSPRSSLGTNVKQILPPEEKERMMRAMGADEVYDVEFTPDIMRMSARDFAAMLRNDYGMCAAVAGEDYTFGRDAAGDTATLAKLGREMGFDVITVPLVEMDGSKISSTRLREALEKGDTEAVRRLTDRDGR